MKSIILYTRKGKKFIVCSCHVHKIKGYSWHTDQLGYLKSSLHGTTIRIQRLILDAAPGQHVDHVNGDVTDNRCSNLRLANQSQNMANRKINKNNTSGYKGVGFWDKKWKAYIGYKGSTVHLGSFNSAQEAAKAYNQKALLLFGEYARLNKIGG